MMLQVASHKYFPILNSIPTPKIENATPDGSRPDLVGRAGFEPATIGLKDRCSTTELPAHNAGIIADSCGIDKSYRRLFNSSTTVLGVQQESVYPTDGFDMRFVKRVAVDVHRGRDG
jgi:hypothetical protein